MMRRRELLRPPSSVCFGPAFDAKASHVRGGGVETTARQLRASQGYCRLQAGAFGGAKHEGTLAAGHESRLLIYLAGTWP